MASVGRLPPFRKVLYSISLLVELHTKTCVLGTPPPIPSTQYRLPLFRPALQPQYAVHSAQVVGLGTKHLGPGGRRQVLRPRISGPCFQWPVDGELGRAETINRIYLLIGFISCDHYCPAARYKTSGGRALWRHR